MIPELGFSSQDLLGRSQGTEDHIHVAWDLYYSRDSSTTVP